MKTKYLLTAMALPLMVACTQDEVVSQDNNQAATLETRVNAGKIAFTTGEGESRFNYITGKFEKGDKFRLFLMDDENGDFYFEEENANETWFMEQRAWNQMYEIDNNFDTNIPFTYNGINAWENDDAIVEGNYFAVLPSQGKQQALLDKVKNRRDVWVYINPVQKFDVSKLVNGNKIMLDGIQTNQFFLGYSQVYRNEQMVDENNTLQLPLQMRPIMANVDLAIKNVASEEFKVEKIVISRLDGSPMPTIAYVRPDDNTPENFGMRQDDGHKYYTDQWAKMANDVNIQKFVNRYGFEAEGALGWQLNGDYIDNLDEDGTPAFAQPYITDTYTDKCGNQYQDFYWSIDSWTRTAARSVVEYSYPGQDGLTPYGLTGAEALPAYEYVLDFTDANGEGVILKNLEGFRAFFALPHNMYMREYTFTVYGQRHDTLRDRWDEGIIIPQASDMIDLIVSPTDANGIFTLPNLDPSSETDYLQANIYFDAFAEGKSRIIQTANADDLMNHLESYYGKKEDGFNKEVNKNEIFYVETMGDFVITNELVDYVQALYDRYGITGGSKALIYFVRTTGTDGHGQLIFPANLTNNHAIDLFYYSKATDIVNEGVQMISKNIIYNNDKSIEELVKAIEASSWYADRDRGILNDGIDLLDKIEPAIANALYGGVGHITNAGTLVLDNVVIETAYYGSAISDEVVAPAGIYNMEGATLNMVNSMVIAGGDMTDEWTKRDINVHNDGELTMAGSQITGSLYNSGITDILADGGTPYVDAATDFFVAGPSSWVTTTVYNANVCNGCKKEPAVLNVLKDATFYAPRVVNGLSGLGTVNVYGTVYFGGNNFDTINVNAGGYLAPDAIFNLVNEYHNGIAGVINVENATLQYVQGNDATAEIVNNGIIYVIGKSHVYINKGTGIIDVTAADTTGGYEAKSLVVDTYFRYTKSVDDATLAKVISALNHTTLKNPVILEFSADDAQDVTKVANLAKIKVNSGTVTLEGDRTSMTPLKDATVPGLGNSYDALFIAPDAQVIVPLTKMLHIGSKVKVYVYGGFHAKNTAALRGQAEVLGNGNFHYAGNNCNWVFTNFAGTYTGI